MNTLICILFSLFLVLVNSTSNYKSTPTGPRTQSTHSSQHLIPVVQPVQFKNSSKNTASTSGVKSNVNESKNAVVISDDSDEEFDEKSKKWFESLAFFENLKEEYQSQKLIYWTINYRKS